MSYLETIEVALREGGRLHAFLSGGGLRVVRIERDDDGLVAYGEHPNVEDALSHVAEDYLAGGRPYDEVYGGSKPHYLTGSCTPTSELDSWIRQGQTFDIFVCDGLVHVELRGYFNTKAPEGMLDHVRTHGPTTWEARGYTFLSYYAPFANGDPAYMTETVSYAEGKPKFRDHHYWAKKVGIAKTLREALDAAFLAEEIEINGD